ncbi:MAG: SUMF1/EgtB/PvdO family nonheme iron enzyme [bacterium]
MLKYFKKLLPRPFIIFTFVLGIFAAIFANYGLNYTSENQLCDSCHVHPQATISWKQGTHNDNKSGVVVDCVQCHLPPGGLDYLAAKMSTGARDVFGMLFKNTTDIDWEEKSQRDFAAKHVYKASCISCHQNLFPRNLGEKGEKAHLHFSKKPEALRCINCHLTVGHYHKRPPEITSTSTNKEKILYTDAAKIDSFVDFTETIPGTSIGFEMIAIPGGEFTIGSADDEPYRNSDESPQRQIRSSPFWMAKTEVSWDEYEAFYQQTGALGRSEDQAYSTNGLSVLDAITGPTPPYGNPDQGWGRGKRPAITMTHYAAQKYCDWLSKITGKKYRLPTEAEWEYAARGGANGLYYFDGSPEDLDETRFLNRLFGVDRSEINAYVHYQANSNGKTSLPNSKLPNPIGLLNMLGNVKEFCSDWYAPDAYAKYPANQVTVNPTGPVNGTQHVIRGGSYRSLAVELRLERRDYTRREAWQLTDPQIPKSLWWYSDNHDVGFRVVCEYEKE